MGTGTGTPPTNQPPAPTLTPGPLPAYGETVEGRVKLIDKILQWGSILVSIAIIPLVVWIFSVENRLGEKNKEIAVLQEKNATYQRGLDGLTKISTDLNKLVGENNTSLLKFQGDFKVTNNNIGHIKINVKRLEKLTGDLNALLKGK